MNYNRFLTRIPTRSNDDRNERNELMRYADHERLLKYIKNQINFYFSQSDQWMYDAKDIPKYMLLDHLALWKRVNLHSQKMQMKLNENLNKTFNV